MDWSTLIGFLNNASLLLFLFIIYELLVIIPKKYQAINPILSGILIALICVVIMSVPFSLQPGIIIDSRSILISVTALVFGAVPTLIVLVVAIIYRIMIGGTGMFVGISVISSSALIGLAWKKWVYNKSSKYRWISIFGMSVVVHVVMIAFFLLLPYPDNFNSIRVITVPVLLIFTTTTSLLSLLIIRQDESRVAQVLLKESEDQFRVLFEEAPLGYQSLDINGYILDVNEQWVNLLGYTKEEVVGCWFGDFLANEYKEAFKNRFEFFKKQGFIHSEFMMNHKNGKQLFIAFDGQIRHTLDNEFKQTHCILKDITEQKALEFALNESERSKSVLLSNLPGMAYRCNYDVEWTMQFVSDGCLELTGYRAESLIQNRDISFNQIISPEYSELLWNEWQRTLALKETFTYEYEIITLSGIHKWVLEKGEGIYDESGNVSALEGIIIDITDRRKLEEKLKYNSDHDSWTQLPNINYLENIFNNDYLQNNVLIRALITIDLSQMKHARTQYGFDYSQALVKKIVSDLKQFCNNQRMLFHIYENRFSFYVKGYKDKNDLIYLCHEIEEMLEQLLSNERIRGGIGIAEIAAEQESDFNITLRKSVLAAENVIKNSYKDFDFKFYVEEMDIEIIREQNIEQEISDLITNGNPDRLYLQFQPILDLKNNKISGFEALARFNSDRFGLVSPIEFIAIAEKTKLIISLGREIIIQAFNFVNSLKEKGYKEVLVSINVSVIQLLRDDFLDDFFKLINEMNIDPTYIGIEITETVFSSNYTRINMILNELRVFGVQVLLDDFGTEYSSLSRERELNISMLKIDKSFIDRILHVSEEETITEDIISIAHKYNHRVVAEGVEHEMQLKYLIKHNCDKAQGFLISKPLDSKVAIEFLERGYLRAVE